MRASRTFAAAAIALSATVAAAQTVQQQVSAGQGAVGAAQLVELEATVQSVDQTTREVVLKTEDGRELAITAGPDVQRLAEVKAGDQIQIQYYESLTLALSKVEGGTTSRSESSTELRAEPTELPGGIKAKQTTITAKVTAVDAATSTVTLVGPKGRSVELAVEPERLKNVKVGDLVSAVYTEAIAVSLSRPDAN